jgi:hypothetical protein
MTGGHVDFPIHLHVPHSAKRLSPRSLPHSVGAFRYLRHNRHLNNKHRHSVFSMTLPPQPNRSQWEKQLGYGRVAKQLGVRVV